MRFYLSVHLWKAIPVPDSATEVMSLRADDGFDLMRSRDGQALVIRKPAWELDIPWVAVRTGIVDLRRSDPEATFPNAMAVEGSPFAKATEILKPSIDQKLGGSFTKDVKGKR